MPLDVSRRNRKRRDMTVEVTLSDGSTEKINLAYDPNALFTPAIARSQRLARKDLFAKVESVAEMLERFLIEWDVTNGGLEFPPTFENLATLELDLLVGILNEVVTQAQKSDTELEAEAVAAAVQQSDTSLADQLGISPPREFTPEDQVEILRDMVAYAKERDAQEAERAHPPEPNEDVTPSVETDLAAEPEPYSTPVAAPDPISSPVETSAPEFTLPGTGEDEAPPTPALNGEDQAPSPTNVTTGSDADTSFYGQPLSSGTASGPHTEDQNLVSHSAAGLVRSVDIESESESEPKDRNVSY